MSTIEELEERIKQLEDQVLKHSHVYPLPIYGPGNDWYGTKKQCSKCGVVSEGIWGYACPNCDCPMGMGPISC